ncbi:hypothetical protein [Streptomyces sp. NPDC005385]|uniref:hypothetical protein n=1 Tax=Streptomyces sp. NPDC005385 TaxID=3157039 RepID=UPI0033B49421
MSDGIEWIDDDLGPEGFSLLMVKGIGHEELAVRLGARPGTVMAPDTARETLGPSRELGQYGLPDYALVGETGNGWAFAIESPEVPSRSDRLAPSRDLWSEYTVVSVWDTTMDPPVIRVAVDGKPHWMLWEYGTDHVDHPLTRSLVAHGGFVERADRVYRDDASDGAMSDVYALLGAHYGLTLPRRAIADRQLPYVFTEPDILIRPQARCPACGGDRMLPYGGGSWSPGEYRLVCVYYKVRGVAGYPHQGCPGEISGPALVGAVREEPNPKYARGRLPRLA